MKHGEMFYISHRIVSLLSQLCVARFNSVDVHPVEQRSITRFCFASDRSERVQSPFLANLLFHFMQRCWFALREWQNNTDKMCLQILSCLI